MVLLAARARAAAGDAPPEPLDAESFAAALELPDPEALPEGAVELANAAAAGTAAFTDAWVRLFGSRRDKRERRALLELLLGPVPLDPDRKSHLERLVELAPPQWELDAPPVPISITEQDLRAWSNHPRNRRAATDV